VVANIELKIFQNGHVRELTEGRFIRGDWLDDRG